MKYVITLVLSLGLMACQGPQGDQGATGAQAPDIIHVPVPIQKEVNWVQFCPGITTYPSTFVEGGFCIDHKIYAVYSANNGFLTLLPPGNYSSNAIGSNCSFTLLDDCQIQ